MCMKLHCLLLAVAWSGMACSSLPAVKPWEKGLLAKPAMTFEYEALDAMFAEHTYSSKEAAAGGLGVSGGGCGCN